jgi:hypothetical protein
VRIVKAGGRADSGDRFGLFPVGKKTCLDFAVIVVNGEALGKREGFARWHSLDGDFADPLDARDDFVEFGDVEGWVGAQILKADATEFAQTLIHEEFINGRWSRLTIKI